MKIGQVIEYSMRTIYHEEPHTKCGGQTIPRPLPKNQN